MNREEASFILANIDRRVCDDELNDALDMAIKALEQEEEKAIKMRDATSEEQKSVDDYIKSISKPTGVDFWDLEQEPCDNAIDRSKAIMIASGYCHPANVAKELAKLPPVTPQPKTGHWIKTPHGFKCSRCLIVHSHPSIFCPSCGARMIEPQGI